MEAVWGAVGAAAAVFACCGLPLLAALAMAALGRQGKEQSQGKDGGHACCPPLGAAGEGGRGGRRERGAARWAAPALALAAALLLAAWGGGGAPMPSTPPTEVAIRAIRTIRFDRSELTVAANRDVRITFANEDTGVAHNFAIYRDSAFREKLYETEVREPPYQATLTVRLPPGRYYFRCDVHPAQMKGTLAAR